MNLCRHGYDMYGKATSVTWVHSIRGGDLGHRFMIMQGRYSCRTGIDRKRSMSKILPQGPALRI